MWIEVTARAEPLSTSSTLRLEAMMRDVTERKKLQDQSRDLYHQLAQAEKLAALGQTISGVAHELNNPLGDDPRVRRTAGRAAARRDDPPRPRCDSQRRRARRPHRPQPADVRAQAPHDAHDGGSEPGRPRDDRAPRATSSAPSNVTIIDALAAGLPPVFADPHQIQQILLNLVINAEQAMLAAHGRGTLILRSWQDPDRDAVVLEVNDDGPGVPEDMQPKIFDPFFTTKAVGKGTGLGPDRRLRDRPGARRTDQRRVSPGPRRVVPARAAGERRARPSVGSGSPTSPAGRAERHARARRRGRAGAWRRGRGRARRRRVSTRSRGRRRRGARADCANATTT